MGVGIGICGRTVCVMNNESEHPLLLGEDYRACPERQRRMRSLMHRHLPNYTSTSIPNARRLRKEMTDAERKVWSGLRRNQPDAKFGRQLPSGHYILDFYCARGKICVDLDGSQHYVEEGRSKDQVRDAYLRRRGYKCFASRTLKHLRIALAYYK